MTTNIIVKVLKKCINNDIMQKNCEKCPYAKYDNECMDVMLKQVIKHIDEQQETIDNAKIIIGELFDSLVPNESD